MKIWNWTAHRKDQNIFKTNRYISFIITNENWLHVYIEQISNCETYAAHIKLSDSKRSKTNGRIKYVMQM